MDKKEILKRLQEHWDFAVQMGHDQDNFLGIFLYGSQNYDMANEDSDVDSIIVVIPKFEEFCFSNTWLSKGLAFGHEHIILKDIREMRHMFMKQSINFLEILFTKYFILNPKYHATFHKYFIKNREVISHYDREQTIKSVSGRIKNALKDYTDNKKLYNAHRLYFFLRDYLKSKSYAECLKPTGEELNFLMNLKYKDIYTDSGKEAMAKTLMEDLQELILGNLNVQSPSAKKALSALDNGTIEILKESFCLNKEQTGISKKDFFKKLTNSEIKAYYSIVNEIHEEGHITIQKLVEKNSISRPVYTNLFVKLKENDVAEVVSKGMKGTYIRIKNPEMLAEAAEL